MYKHIGDRGQQIIGANSLSNPYTLIVGIFEFANISCPYALCARAENCDEQLAHQLKDHFFFQKYKISQSLSLFLFSKNYTRPHISVILLLIPIISNHQSHFTVGFFQISNACRRELCMVAAPSYSIEMWKSKIFDFGFMSCRLFTFWAGKKRWNSDQFSNQPTSFRFTNAAKVGRRNF